jgi:hypothetical protein
LDSHNWPTESVIQHVIANYIVLYNDVVDNYFLSSI